MADLFNRIWAADDTEKIKADDMSSSLADGTNNSVWNGSQVSIFGGKNEVVGFQLIIEATASGLSDVDVELPSLTNGVSVIENTGTSDPFDYVGKRIEFFTVLYWDVPEEGGTPVNRIWKAGAAPGAYYESGYLPVGIIPFEAADGKGGAPFDIAASMNQSVWVDIYIPKNAVAGNYTGTITVSATGSDSHEIPITLKVYNFTLSDETHFKNFFFGFSHWLAYKHGVSDGSEAYKAIEGKYFQMAHRHRMDLCMRGNLAYIENHFYRYLDGTFYGASNNYEGPGANIGHGTYSIGTYDQPDNGGVSGFLPATEEGWQDASDNWVNWFSNNAANCEIFKYMIDEPSGDSEYENIQIRSNWVQGGDGPGNQLGIFCTVALSAANNASYPLDGYVTFWSESHGSYMLANAQAQQANGAKCGLYNGSLPHYGTGFHAIDAHAASCRSIPWVARRYGVEQYFYWCFNAQNNLNPFQYVDPADSYNILGDGFAILPGEENQFPAENRALAGPIATFNMKAWRRGQQDYEYMWLLDQAGKSANTNAIVATVVPQALDQLSDNVQPAWPLTGKGFEDYRQDLAELLNEEDKIGLVWTK